MPFNPPPTWPPPPHRDWVPGPQWRPPEQWGPAPPGWDFGEWPGKEHSVFAATVETQRPTRRWARATSTFVNHPLWTTAGAVLGIVGLVISGFQIYQATQPNPVDLEMSMTSFAAPAKVGAVSYNGATGTYGDAVDDATATPVDLTLQNNGGEPSLITRITATVTYVDRLQDCTGSGAGPMQVAAEYTIKISNSGGEPSTGTYTRDVRFEVKPEAVDRMTITVGPEFESADNFAYVVGFDLTLIHDDGSRLDAGKYALVSNLKAVDANIATSTSARCAASNLTSIDQAFAPTTLISDELERLRTTYQSLAG